MSTPTFTPRGGHPYPPVAFDNTDKAVARIAEATRDWPRPQTEPVYRTVGDLMDAQAAVVSAPPLDRRVPGATLRRPVESFAAFPGPVRVPEPAQAPSPVAAPRWPEGVVRGMLLNGLWDAARWYGDLDPESCADCGAHGGLCDFHAPRCVKALEYEELHNYLVDSQSDAAALSGIAIAIRAGSAEIGDIAALGSPLESLLLAQLARLGADGGVR